MMEDDWKRLLLGMLSVCPVPRQYVHELAWLWTEGIRSEQSEHPHETCGYHGRQWNNQLDWAFQKLKDAGLAESNKGRPAIWKLTTRGQLAAKTVGGPDDIKKYLRGASCR